MFLARGFGTYRDRHGGMMICSRRALTNVVRHELHGLSGAYITLFFAMVTLGIYPVSTRPLDAMQTCNADGMVPV